MDRKQFLKTCASGLCACAAACISVGAKAADTASPDDWKPVFVQKRYAKLLAIMSGRMSKAEMSSALQDLGAYCAAESLGTKIEPYRGDVDGFIKYFGQLTQGSVKIDRLNTGYVQTFTPSDGNCSCPLVSRAAGTPGVVCECSVGWARQIWGQVLDRQPNVQLRESVMRGGKSCVSEITPA